MFLYVLITTTTSERWVMSFGDEKRYGEAQPCAFESTVVSRSRPCMKWSEQRQTDDS